MYRGNLASEHRLPVRRAIGPAVVPEQAQLAMDGAFSRLRSFARSHNRRLTDVARDVIDGNLHTRQLT